MGTRNAFFVGMALMLGCAWAQRLNGPGGGGDGKPGEDPAEALLTRLRTGEPAARLAALRKIAQQISTVCAAIRNAYEKATPPRPVIPRSFAMQLRIALDGEHELLAAARMATDDHFTGVVKGPQIRNGGQHAQEPYFAITSKAALDQVVGCLNDANASNLFNSPLVHLSYYGWDAAPAVRVRPFLNELV